MIKRNTVNKKLRVKVRSNWEVLQILSDSRQSVNGPYFSDTRVSLESFEFENTVDAKNSKKNLLSKSFINFSNEQKRSKKQEVSTCSVIIPEIIII